MFLAKHHRALLIMGAGHFLRGHPQVLRDELLIQQHRPVPPLNKAQLGPDYIERTLRAAGANPYLVVFGTNVVDEERSSRNTQYGDSGNVLAVDRNPEQFTENQTFWVVRSQLPISRLFVSLKGGRFGKHNVWSTARLQGAVEG
jgi:hypothetical protein